MNASMRAGRSRRARMDRDRYRSVARRTGVKARLRRPLVILDVGLLLVAAAFLWVAAPRVGGALGTGADDFRGRLAEYFPALDGGKQIELPTTGATVNAQLAADNLPDFTRDPSLKITGRVPAFAMVAGRVVAVKLNGTIATTVPPDAGGAFAAALTLTEGPNAIELTLLSGNDVIANSSYTVVLDRQPPTLTLTKPASGDSVEAPTITVQGKADAGATVVVNDRTIVPAQDGSFTDSFTATAGPLTITVVARDRAGNETTVKSQVTVKAATTATVAVSVSLDKTKVTPGGFVTATVFLTANGAPRANEQVTLSVGVIPIASATTDRTGIARISFFAPPNEGEAAVVVLASGASGRATLTVAK
jgi:hypothetical protein